MSERSLPDNQAMPVELKRHVNDVCNRFEAAWKQGRVPRIEDHLGGVPEPAQAVLLQELAMLDAYYRSQFGQADDAGKDAGANISETRSFRPITEGPGAIVAGRFKLLQKLGEGGMGAVYMAEQEQPVKRRVALKIIKAGMDSPQVIARFEQECQALAMMDHPNIAKVLDAGYIGNPFFVMELVKGIPLTKFCDQEHLTPRERLELFIPVCQAVQHAHQKGIIHRDLKPSNVLVALYDGKPVPKVIDFGVAKATAQKLTERTMFTEVGQMVGTLEYMAPEQAELNNLDIDTRADIYSLGVILYELLTGTPPFTARELRSAAFTEMLRMIREVEPPKPSAKLSSSAELPSIAARRKLEPKRLTKLVTGELDWIAMKCLEKERGRRYETANGLAMDIQRFLRDEPVLAGPPSASYRLRKSLRRHKGPVIAATVILLALMAGITGTTVESVRANAALEMAEKQQERAEGNFERALAAVDRMLTQVGEKRLAQVPQMEETRQRLLEDALEFYREFLKEQSADPLVRRETARAYQRMGKIYQMLGKYEDAETQYQQALTIQSQLVRDLAHKPDYGHEMAASYQELGDLLRDTGRSNDAERAYQQALEVLSPIVDSHPENDEFQESLAASLNSLGILYRNTGRAADAEVVLQKALSIRQGVAGRHRGTAQHVRDLAESYASLAELHELDGNLSAAETHWKKVLEIREQLIASHPADPELRYDLAQGYHRLGRLYEDRTRFDDAIEMYNKSVSVAQKLANDHDKVLEYQHALANTYNQIGFVDYCLGKLTESEASYEQSLSILRELARDYPQQVEFAIDYANAYGDSALTLREHGDVDQCLKRLDDAVETLRSVLNRDSENTRAMTVLAWKCQGRAETLVRLDRLKEAQQDWRLMVELAEGQTSANLRLSRAMGRSRLGDYALATAEAEELLGLDKEPQYAEYNFACIYSASSGFALNDTNLSENERQALSEKYATRAMELLKQFRPPSEFFKTHYLAKDTDLDPLRERDDFKQWIATGSGIKN